MFLSKKFSAIKSSFLIFFLSLFYTLLYNQTFYQKVLEIYPFGFSNIIFLLALTLVTIGLLNILLALVCYRITIKPVLILLTLICASSAYFIDTYKVIVDESMIDNIFKTDLAEVADLMTMKFVLYMLLLGLLPAFVIYKTPIKFTSFRQAVIEKSKLFGFSLVIIIISLLIQGSYFASFFREHKTIRFYSNPTYVIYSLGKYAAKFYHTESTAYQQIGKDAVQITLSTPHKIMILVIGETARADHFSLNGYDRLTNPQLQMQDIINFDNVWSCGTSTATSVPCMFSFSTRDNYQAAKALNTDNILDVLNRAGIDIYWLDNNSDSKGVADRVHYENFKTRDNNAICNPECRDEGMLSRVNELLASQTDKDMLIVLHQMGNHGPAYYKRYPKSFEKFTPLCETNQLDQCSQESIINAYDNALLYTDYFLHKSIVLLKQYSANFQTALLYVSDHGESLGENNIYLHGLPYFIAPDAQKHVPMLMWFSPNFAVQLDKIINQRHGQLSHDNLVHTLLGIFDVNTALYQEELDITHEN